jgi:hypothetical protein
VSWLSSIHRVPPLIAAIADTARFLAAALGLVLPPAAEVLARLRETATGAGPEFDLVCTPEGTTYERLI